MNSDIFENSGAKPLNNKSIEDDNNFFVQPDNISMRGMLPSEVKRHLNDYDANILKEGAYRDVEDEVFKLEYKISHIEEEIKDLDKQIQSANVIYDYFTADKLASRQKQLKEELFSLTEIYKEASLSAKISGGFAGKLKSGIDFLGKMFSNNLDNFISKLPGKFSSFLVVKNSLNQLESINKSVDDLMKYQHPYGEAGEKYEQLSRYIAKANSIQSEIYKFMK